MAKYSRRLVNKLMAAKPWQGGLCVRLLLLEVAVCECARRVHPTSGELLGVWYNAHRSRDGCWAEGAQVLAGLAWVQLAGLLSGATC
jgi:hypothetical protein